MHGNAPLAQNSASSVQVVLSLWQKKASVGSFPTWHQKACVSQVSGRRKKWVRGEIIYLDEDRFNQLFTAVVLVQNHFSECYFEIGNTVVEMFKELSLSFLFFFQGLCSLWKLLLHK